MLHHIWQHRRRDYPGQEASDAVELGRARGAAPVGALPPGAHRRRRRLAPLAARRARAAQRAASISPAAEWTAACSRPASRPSASSGCSGAAISPSRPAGPSCATSSTCSRPPSSSCVRWRNAARHLPARRLSLRLMRIDVNAFLGVLSLPARAGHLARGAARRDGPDRHRRGLGDATCPASSGAIPPRATPGCWRRRERTPRLRPVPAVHPGSPSWEAVLRRRADAGAPAVRCDPTFYGIDPAGPSMRALAAACGAAGHAADARGAARGRPPAAPQRPCAPSCPPPRCAR